MILPDRLVDLGEPIEEETVQNPIEVVKQEYVTLGEAAEMLSVNPATIWRWLKEGKVNSYQLWREVLIEKSEIERIKAERTR